MISSIDIFVTLEPQKALTQSKIGKILLQLEKKIFIFNNY